MNNLLRKLSWCRIPFTYGKATENDDEISRGFRSDVLRFIRFNGAISSIQMFLALITVAFAITLSVYMSVKFDGTINLLALIVYMFVGLTAMFLFNVYREDMLVLTPTGEGQAKRDNLTLIGLAIFYVLGCLLDMFHTITSISCEGVWRICNDGYIYVSFVTDIFFHILRIAYLGGLSMFCITFNRSTFSDKPATRYGLMFLLAATVSLWFDALVHESAHMFTTRPRMSRFSQRCLAGNRNVSSEILDCVYHNNTLYRMAKDYVSPTFLPFTIEFTLLACECLCHWFFHCARNILLMNSETNRDLDDSDVSTDIGILENVVDNIREDHTVTEVSPAYPAPGELDDAFVSDETRPLLESSGKGHQRASTLMSNLFLVVVLILNVLLGVLAILPKCTQPSEAPRYRNLFSVYLLVFWLCMTACVAVGYQVSRDFRYNLDAEFNGLDYLLLITSIGPMAFDTFTLIALFGQEKETLFANETEIGHSNATYALLTVSLELANAVQVYFQVAFSLFAGRIVLGSRDSSIKAAIFKCAVLFLAVANGSLWLVGSFNAFQTSPEQQMNYFGTNNWAIINNFVTPLSLFFRFNSCIMFTRLYLRIHQDNEKETVLNTTVIEENG